MEKHFFQSINLEDPVIKIDTVFQEASINLTVFENSTAWTTLITRPELKISADNHKSEFSEYIKNLQKYLQNCPEDVEIKFKDGTFSINVLLRNNMKAVYFTTNLRKVNFTSTVFTLLEKFYTEKQQQVNILDDKQKQLEKLERLKNNLESKLNDFVDRRQEEEIELYNKFVAILNEKKQHIQHQNELLNAFRRGRPTINDPSNANHSDKKRKTQKNTNKKTRIEKKAEIDEPNPSTEEEASYSSEEEISKKKPDLSPRLSPIPGTSKDAIINNSSDEDEIFHKKLKPNGQKDFQSPGITCQSDQETPESQRIDFDTQDLLDQIP